MIYQYVCSLSSLSIRILLVFEGPTLIDLGLSHHDRIRVVEAVLLPVGRLLRGVVSALSAVVDVHISQLRRLVQHSLRHLGLAS